MNILTGIYNLTKIVALSLSTLDLFHTLVLKGGVVMSGQFNSCCKPVEPCCQPNNFGCGKFSFVLVIFILLVIVGAAWVF